MAEREYSSSLAVERAVDILFLIAERGEVSLTDLAREIGSSGSAVHRILMALKIKGLVEQLVENGPYSLSWSILAMTRRLTEASDLRTVSLPLMTRLRDLTGETVTLNVRSALDRVCIDSVEGLHEIRWHPEIGRISPLYAGATGKVLLAFMGSNDVDHYLQSVKLERLTPFTTVDPKKLERELSTTRARGYAIGSQDRMLGVIGVSAPVLGTKGVAAAAVTIAGPVDRLTRKQLDTWLEPLTAATSKISKVLGLETATGDSLSRDKPARVGVSVRDPGRN